MLVILINKILVLLFCLSLLNVIRQAFFFIRAILLSEDDVDAKPYILSKSSLFILGLSISFILSLIITGYKL